MKWRIVDAIGPFFRSCSQGRINWSKIPFGDVEREILFDDTAQEKLCQEFRNLCSHLAERDFNVITLDNMAHLLEGSFYTHDLNEKIQHYQKLFRKLFSIATEHSLKVWITTDFIYCNDDLEDHIGSSSEAWMNFFGSRVIKLFDMFSEVDGLILRVGESDGMDVQGDFQSRPMIKYHRQLNKLLKTLMPIFDQKEKILVMRNWSVGMYQVGDMMWNKSTMEKVFDGIESDRLVVSMKYGESDFFRYLDLNKLFLKLKRPMIIELQARREYEGAGEYPSFIGYDYKRYRKKLNNNEHLVGTMVWIQTGGWTHFRRLTYLDKDSVWNQINADTIQLLFHHGKSLPEVIEILHQRYASMMSLDEFSEFLKNSHDVIKQLLYFESFAMEKLYFRRVRVPPLMGMTWDSIWIHPMVARMVYHFGADHQKIVKKGWKTMRKLERMLEIAKKHHWNETDLEFQYDTFHLLAKVREVYFGEDRFREGQRIKAEIEAYENKYPLGYRIHYNEKVRYIKHDNRAIRWLRWILRSKKHYRWVDQWIVIRFLALVFPVLYQLVKVRIPKELRNQAMGIGSLFK